jgi:Tol biopolymer transport system component
MISDLVEDESGFALPADGARLAYFEMDRDLGEARLVSVEMATGSRTVLATLPIPKGTGSSLPESANLSWSQDGKALAFEFGRSQADRAVYLVHADGAGAVKMAGGAHAPAISADGRCLAYISDNQAFVVDLAATALSLAATPVHLADLPAGRGVADFRLDKLVWMP